MLAKEGPKHMAKLETSIFVLSLKMSGIRLDDGLNDNVQKIPYKWPISLNEQSMLSMS